MPMKFVITKRRLMYLWNILQRDGKELLKKVYLAQQVVQTKHDWAELVTMDKLDMEIDLTDEEISKMKESKFKNIVDKAVAKKALQHLNTTADSHSKSRILKKLS